MTADAPFSDILEDPVRGVALDPAIYVELKDRDLAKEEQRQAAYVSAMRRLAHRVLVFAVPNGARRTRWEANKAKREGLYTGFPDTGACWTGVTAYIEFKDGSSMPNQSQIETLNRLHAMGHPVAVCRTAVGAMRWLREQGAPVPEVRQ